MCQEVGTTMVIDSTFATPVNQRALSQGADLVIHSATKYLAGHNDVLAGAVCGSSELIGKIRDLHAVLGGVLDPHAAYLTLRGLKTLNVHRAALACGGVVSLLTRWLACRCAFDSRTLLRNGWQSFSRRTTRSRASTIRVSKATRTMRWLLS